MYCKVLEVTYNTGSMPATVSISVASSHSMNKHLPTHTRPNNPGTGLPTGNIPSSIYNNAYTPGSLNLDTYKVATLNCQVNDATLRSLATSLISGHTTQVAQATAIFNWVRNNIAYEYYFNTVRGAKNTYNQRRGNCVDQSHLLIALYRAAGYPARYVNGECRFGTSTSRTGHVWTQVLIGNTWVVGDPISTSNSLGVINNWNSPIIYGYYREITF